MKHNNFLNLPPDLSDPERAGVMILPLPLDISASWKRGIDEGPRAIIEASHHIEFYDDEFGSEVVVSIGGIATHPVVELPTDPAKAAKEVEALASALVRAGRVLIAIGGEHSLTYPLALAHRKLFGEFSVLQIDAHADMRQDYMGSRHNHACPMRRLMEEGIHVTSVGIRSVDESELQVINGPLNRTFFASEVAGRLAAATDAIIASLPGESVYITVDLDGFDPAVFPAVGTPVPGGLGWYETLGLLREACRRRRVIGADVVELCPREGLHYADSAAARLVYKLAAYSAGLK